MKETLNQSIPSLFPLILVMQPDINIYTCIFASPCSVRETILSSFKPVSGFKGCQLGFSIVGMGEGIKKMVHGFSSTASLSCDSGDSIVSSSSSDLTEDATSSSPDGSLYDLSSLMSHLPIKRGLSKFYQGKSESFTSLSNAVCVGDLAKKVSPYRRKMKLSKSIGGLDASKKTSCTLRPCSKTISKKPTRVPGFHVLL